MEPSLNPAIPSQREQLRRLFLIKRTEGKMLSERGFSLNPVKMMKPDHSFVEVNLAMLQDPLLGMGEIPTPSPFFSYMLEFRQQTGLFQSRQEFSSIYYTPDGQRRILVLYLNNEPDKSVKNENFKIVNEFVKTGEIHNIILVTTTGLNPDTSSRVRNRMLGYTIEVFLDSELAFDWTKHAIAPISVEYIPNSEKESWAQREKVQPEKLPMMLNTDPIAKWYGAKPMDIFQMELMGTTTDTMGYGRIVRQAPIKS